jgi:thiamine pyrophosphate-dependent acetolactate synthase large subunit-like protein
MLTREEAIRDIFKKHGDGAVYITNTGYHSRAVYNLYPKNKNILFMQGSMGLGPSIGLGIALNTDKNVVVFVGDASLLMHLGSTHTIRDYNLKNLFVYVMDNGCHESVGGYESSKLENKYPGITEIIKISCDGKTNRVGLKCKENISNLKEFIK